MRSRGTVHGKTKECGTDVEALLQCCIRVQQARAVPSERRNWQVIVLKERDIFFANIVIFVRTFNRCHIFHESSSKEFLAKNVTFQNFAISGIVTFCKDSCFFLIG